MRRISEFSSVLRATWGRRRSSYMTTSVVTVSVSQMKTSDFTDCAQVRTGGAVAIHPPLNDARLLISLNKVTQNSFLNSLFSSDLHSERVSHRPSHPAEVLPMHCQREVPNIHNKLIPYPIISLPHLLSKPLRFRVCPFHRPACKIPFECALSSLCYSPIFLQMHKL